MSNSDQSDSESDIEIKSRLSTKTVKALLPKSPEEHLVKEKKLTVKEMINSALKEQKSRKGVSLYAIKKYMVDNYNADTEKINFYIKKYIKSGVEDGSIVQTKGIGASGSFRLAPIKKPEKKIKKKKIAKPEKANTEKTERPKKMPAENNKTEKKVAKNDGKLVKEKIMKDMTKTKDKETKTSKTQSKEKIVKESKEKVTKESKKSNKTKMQTVENKTPAKKKVIVMRKKSIGSLIKTPKMKPRKI